MWLVTLTVMVTVIRFHFRFETIGNKLAARETNPRQIRPCSSLVASSQQPVAADYRLQFGLEPKEYREGWHARYVRIPSYRRQGGFGASVRVTTRARVSVRL